MPIYSGDIVEHRNRTLRMLYSIAEMLRGSNEINEKIFMCLNCSPNPIPVYKIALIKDSKVENSADLFPGNRYIAGRSKRSDIVLDDPKVSGIHCVLTCDDLGRLYIMDAASLNRTFLDGLSIQPLKNTLLSPSSCITTGSTLWRITRTWNKLTEEPQSNFSSALKIIPNSQSAAKYHKYSVKSKGGDQVFELYISLPTDSDLLLQYYGLSPKLPACAFLADQLLSELETVFFETLVNRFNSIFSERFQLEYLGESRGNTENLIQSDLTLWCAERSFRFTFLVDPRSISGFCNCYEDQMLHISKTAFSSFLESLSITFHCLSRNIPINKSHFEKLKIGDVLFPGWFVQEKCDIDLSNQSFYLAIPDKDESPPLLECSGCFVHDDLLLRVNGSRINKENKMDQVEYENSSQGVTSLCETQFLDLRSEPIVTMKIEIGRLQLSVEELCNLKSGMLIRVNRKIDEPMDILVGDQIIGVGRLVQIHDEYGVEIVSWKETE